MSEPALSLNFFDPEHGLSGSARSGMTLLFEGSHSEALPDGPAVKRTDDGWHAELPGAFALDLAPIAAAAAFDGVAAHVCVVTGMVGDVEVRCLGTVAETSFAPSWEEVDALRSISLLFDERHALLAVGRRPRGAHGHNEEQIEAWLLDDGEPVALEEVRLSTVYDGEGRQRSAGLELWLEDEDFPLRGSGTVVAGSSLQLESADAHVAVFRWRMGNREGMGAYELMTRSEPEAA